MFIKLITSKSILLLIILITALLNSCFKDEDTIMTLSPHQPGDPLIKIMETSIYSTQAYFSLENNEIVGENDKIIWDLGFEGNDSGWHVILNAAKMMRAAKVDIDFENITTISVVEQGDWHWDKSDGNLDSTAIGTWINFSTTPATISNSVYLINRGYDVNGNQLGYKKMQLIGYDGTRYQIRFADLNGNNDVTKWIEKDSSIYFVAFSFNNDGESMILEPKKENWDILFSQYTGVTYTLIGEPYPYFVQGVLLNRHGVSAVVDTNYFFNEIDYDIAKTLTYSTKMDTIGHLWKWVYVNMETMESVYTCDTSRNHIIKTREGDYFKLRFLSFYNSEGIKGFTTIEFQKL